MKPATLGPTAFGQSHEATDPVGLRARTTNHAPAEAVVAHHATPEQFAEVSGALAVDSHTSNAPRILEQTRKSDAGPIEGPKDLLRIDVSGTVAVHRRSR